MSLSARSITAGIRDLFPDELDECVVCYSPTRALDVQCATCKAYVCKACLPQLQKPSECPHCRSQSNWQRLNAVGLRVCDTVVSAIGERLMNTLDAAAARVPPMEARSTELAISWRARNCEACGGGCESAFDHICSGCCYVICQDCLNRHSPQNSDGAKLLTTCPFCRHRLPSPSLLRAVARARIILEKVMAYVPDKERFKIAAGLLRRSSSSPE
ncbi:hypothetical protein FOL47_003170 [Perkinsus chesapeaki]|uniref:RING-type domain-containing protein n=1 Tax=Perkinsus chesapeaki TaxID=330153 RepID=A0A7J6M9N7_PERCH|nr:hypothetical protein FOL47_003170 [Perkinsus chesapeaki]